MAAAVPLAADHFADVTGVDTQLEYNKLFTFNHTDVNLIGVIHESLCNCLY